MDNLYWTLCLIRHHSCENYKRQFKFTSSNVFGYIYAPKRNTCMLVDIMPRL